MRYALVWSGINIAILFAILATLSDISIERALLLALPVAAIHILVNGWIWYPRDKRKLTAPAPAKYVRPPF